MLPSEETRFDRTTRKRLLLALGILLALVAIGLIVKSLMTKTEAPKKRTVHEIAVLRQPPPPPPKPEPKPPEIKKEEVKIEQPQPQPKDEPKQSAEAPPEGKLGLDATGTGPGDSFGLEARQGGRDITTIGGKPGGGGGSSRAQFAFYTNMLKQHFDEELAKRSKLRATEYRVVVSIWLARDGRIERYELAGSSGNSATDAELKLALAGMPPLREPPPETMPQPVRLRITARGAG